MSLISILTPFTKYYFLKFLLYSAHYANLPVARVYRGIRHNLTYTCTSFQNKKKSSTIEVLPDDRVTQGRKECDPVGVRESF